MSLEMLQIHHVNVTVPKALEAAAKHFYGGVLGLRQLQKPEGSRTNEGAWYELGGLQLHLSLEDGVENRPSDRHVCYLVGDIPLAEAEFRDAGVEIIPDPRPMRGRPRFYVRDPGGNLLEIAQEPR